MHGLKLRLGLYPEGFPWPNGEYHESKIKGEIK